MVKDFSTRIQRGDRIGLVGPNGAGKTTLLKMLTGELAPDAGSVRLGVNLEIATLDQKRAAVDPQETLAHFLTDGRGETVVVNGEERHVVSYMKDFLFKAEAARTPVRELSGGERARLILARVLSRPANLLVLDEPTNDLDMETLELLQELVAGFAGTVLLVSHDRDFLDRTVTSIIAPDGGGRWVEYAGGYSDMLAQRGGTKLEDRKSAAKVAPAARCEARRTCAAEGRREEAFLQAEIRAGDAARQDGGGVGVDLGAGEPARRSGLLRKEPRFLRQDHRRPRQGAAVACRHGRGMAGTRNAQGRAGRLTDSARSARVVSPAQPARWRRARSSSPLPLLPRPSAPRRTPCRRECPFPW